MNISIRDQIKCVEREVGIRKAIYPRQVISGKMTTGQKDREIELMQAVLATLRMVERTHLDKPWNQI